MLHAQLSLNRDRQRKTHVNQRPFSFFIFIVRGLRYFFHVIILPKFGSAELPQSIVLLRKA